MTEPPQQPQGGQPYGGQPYGQQYGGPQPQYPGQPYPGQQQPYGGQPPYGQPYPGPQQPYGQQYPGPQQPYGGQPYYGPPDAGAPVARPKEVETSFRLWIASVVLGLLGAALSFTLMPSIIDAAIASTPPTPGLSAENLRAAIQIGLIVGAVVGLAFVALFLLFTFKMRAGRNWARILLAILGGLSILSSLYGVFSGQQFAMGTLGIVSAVLGVVQLVVIAAAIVFMFRPAAAPYFQQQRR